MQSLAFGTFVQVLIGAMFSVVVPCWWAITAFAIVCGATIGFIPVGWHDGNHRSVRVIAPAVAFQWERKLGIRIGTRVLFPNHIWGTALSVFGVWMLARWEIAGWSRVGSEIPVAWYVAHGTVLASMLLTVAIALYAKWRNTDEWRVACAWLRAKKDRVCPRIEFTE